MLAAGLILAAPPLFAARPFIDEPEPITPKSVEAGPKWGEEQFRLPAWPDDRNLVAIKTDTSDARFTHYVDINSLTTGKDEVVRYTVVAESTTGTRNVTFEGMRCTPHGAYKEYAYGVNGKFVPTAVADQWRTLDKGGIDAYRTELWRYYLCVPRLFKPRPKNEQVRMLRSGRVPGVENRGFITN